MGALECLQSYGLVLGLSSTHPRTLDESRPSLGVSDGMRPGGPLLRCLQARAHQPRSLLEEAQHLDSHQWPQAT